MEKEENQKRVAVLAEVISNDYANQQPVLLGV
jgi:hypoxanthine-guanine phosphoribosyltransferase